MKTDRRTIVPLWSMLGFCKIPKRQPSACRFLPGGYAPRNRGGRATFIAYPDLYSKWTMNARTLLAPPVPELPVTDVERAQQYYRDVLGFEVNWIEPDKSIGAVSRGEEFSIFFRKRTPPFGPAVHWIYAPDIDATYHEFQLTGANIVEALEKKPWGLRQFTVEDLDGNRFYIHHD